MQPLSLSLVPLLFPHLVQESGSPASGTPVEGFEVLATIEVGAAPHGIQFSADGSRAYVAIMGEGEVAEIDAQTYGVLRKLPAGQAPLGIHVLGDGRSLLATQFRAESLLPVPLTEDVAGEAIEVAAGASLFAPRYPQGRAYLSCEFADTLVILDTSTGELLDRFDTGKRPYPAAVTRDGVLAFVPSRTEGTVRILDLLNREAAATVEVGDQPTGGALLEDDTTYIAACNGSNALAWINTASFEVVHRTPEVGPGPFSVTTTPCGRFALVNNSGGDTLTILDVAGRTIAGSITVGAQPIAVRMHPDGLRAFVANEISGTVTVVSLPAPPPPSRGPALNEVVMLGTIHSGHRTSELYSLDILREVVGQVDPDYILTEIPPNRAEEAMRGFLADGVVSEPRVVRFPEYLDVIYPLIPEMHFELIPTAGWTEPMARFRSQRLAAIREDPARAEDWARYLAANEASDARSASLGASDDPAFIHSDAYDEAAEIALSVYDELFNDELGPGGWTHINEAHYAPIEAALDKHRGQGKRFLITYGAGHKGWFLRQLRMRSDIRLVEVPPIFEQARAAMENR